MKISCDSVDSNSIRRVTPTGIKGDVWKTIRGWPHQSLAAAVGTTSPEAANLGGRSRHKVCYIKTPGTPFGDNQQSQLFVQIKSHVDMAVDTHVDQWNTYWSLCCMRSTPSWNIGHACCKLSSLFAETRDTILRRDDGFVGSERCVHVTEKSSRATRLHVPCEIVIYVMIFPALPCLHLKRAVSGFLPYMPTSSHSSRPDPTIYSSFPQ